MKKNGTIFKRTSKTKNIHTNRFLDMGIEDPVLNIEIIKNTTFKAMQFVADGHADAVTADQHKQLLL